VKEKRTLKGPHGWTVTLDPREVFPDDPGAGQPVYVQAPFGRGSSSYNAATNEGEVLTAKGGSIEIPSAVMRWLESDEVENAINELFEDRT
jgi:hypothetical protein